MTPELIHLPAGALRLGQTLSFPVFDQGGKLLFSAGHVLNDTPQGRALVAVGAWVRPQDTPQYQRAWAHRLDTLVHQGAVLSDIARAGQAFEFDGLGTARPEQTPREAWSDLLGRTHALLKEEAPQDFGPRLTQLIDTALARLGRHTDQVLLLTIFESSQEFSDYSARHALLSLLLTELVTEQLGWPSQPALRGAALTMNLGSGAAHDRLAALASPATPVQRQTVKDHPILAAQRLAALGIDDPDWLTAVRLHHEAGPGPLGTRPRGEQLARILRRVDQFGARLSPRRSRKALSGAAGARAVYLDETGQPDEAGSALIKAVGLYPPGSLVRLANGEIGVAVRRGYSANEPMVAALIGKSGTPLTVPVLRDTRLASQAVVASLAPSEVKLRPNLDAILKL